MLYILLLSVLVIYPISLLIWAKEDRIIRQALNKKGGNC